MNSNSPTYPKSWSDLPRRAWVTGAGKGIGRALASRLANDGWTVFASSRTESDLASLASEDVAGNGKIIPLPLDINDAEACAAAVREVCAEGKELGLVVLNAGTHSPTPAATFDAMAVNKLIAINLCGTVNCLTPAMHQTRTQGVGKIAVVASVAGYKGLPNAAAYCASKAGLIAMCESLKPELQSDGVDICVINPGFVRTPLTDKNEFPMPFLMELDAAVDSIVTGLKGRAFEIAFPTRFVLILKFLRLLPDALYFKITARMIAD